MPDVLVAALPPCTIGIEACSGAHHWARLFAAHGHTVKLMAPKLNVFTDPRLVLGMMQDIQKARMQAEAKQKSSGAPPA